MALATALGPAYLGSERFGFRVWAPFVSHVEIHVVSPFDRIAALERDARGYHSGIIEDLPLGALYYYRLDRERDRPDPASRSQPEGVHGPSQLFDAHFSWGDRNWHGLPLRSYILYEIHIGTFTAEGTFGAVIPHLERLADLGITALELMPVAQFPGERNWGYDGVYPFAVQNSYGGPYGLKQLVDACHARGIAVVLDVVYNHLGPEGNYLADYGPYFTDRYRTPWGSAINFDGPESDHVRRFFVENALHWVMEFHMDALRIDAVHGIFDFSAVSFLEELAQAIHDRAERLNRHIHLIAESDLNDTRLVRPRELGGFGLDAQWNEDFHHALHCVLTRERTGYYEDFGALKQLAKAFREGFVYSGEYSRYRKRRHGNSSVGIPASRFVVFSQNHDQVGNRSGSERLSSLVPPEALKVAAAAVIFSPYIPLLFMGEEYGETSPFPYFVSHSDASLNDAVRRGRREEFAAFNWDAEPPDPAAEATFIAAKLDHDLRCRPAHSTLCEFYKELIAVRTRTPGFADLSNRTMEVECREEDKVLILRRWAGSNQAIIVFHFSEGSVLVNLDVPAGRVVKCLDSSEECWNGPGATIADAMDSDGRLSFTMAAYSCVVFALQQEA
ncbi:MAG: malto-oligosyltrehalose trehalohydrolase [Desulfomonile sp.]|nr:malto-oligosyltrehalose trehalohydrolase [Desulfomonile sp.]